jgi:hypothetical protein
MFHQEFCIYNGPNYQTHEGESTIRGTKWIVTIAIFMDYNMKVPYKFIFNINNLKCEIIHVIIDINGNHTQKYG